MRTRMYSSAPDRRRRVIARGSERVSRRRFLGGVAAAAGLAAVGLGTRESWSAVARQATPVAAAIGEPLREPTLLHSRDGRLDVTLETRFGPATMGGRDVVTYNFNGEVPGPTLRLRAGETLGVTFRNQMEEITNLHTHGLHVSPSGISDNVFRHIMPGDTVPYEFEIPEDRTSGLYLPGLYWYHPHMHGNSGPQVSGGLVGALIIEGGLDDLPEIRDLPERTLVLQTTLFDESGTVISHPEFEKMLVFVNGQREPTIAIGPGETQRWRVVNASSSMFMQLTLDGHQFHQIGSDANPLSDVWSRDQILLAPGERAEVLVQGGPAGDYRFYSAPWGEELEFQTQPELAIATLVSGGEPVEPAPLPAMLVPMDDLREATVDRSREVVFSQTNDPFVPMIDGKVFDENRIDQTVRLGATEEWTIRNTSEDWHPFHIHVNDFQVVSINGEPHDAHSWKDTAPIPAGGEIVIRTRFLDFPGKFVYHCHILGHEDRGMMGVIEVVE